MLLRAALTALAQWELSVVLPAETSKETGDKSQMHAFLGRDQGSQPV